MTRAKRPPKEEQKIISVRADCRNLQRAYTMLQRRREEVDQSWIGLLRPLGTTVSKVRIQ